MSKWQRTKVSDLCDLIVDCVNKTAPTVPYKTAFKMLRTTNVKNGKIDTQNCRFVEKKTFDKWTRRAKVERGDVLLTREAPMGEVGLVNFEENVFLGQRLVQYRANPKKLDSNFLLYSFLSPDLQYQFRRHSGTGSTVSHIRVPDCTEFEIPLPPLAEQQKIAAVLSALDAKIDCNNRINAELEAMAKTLYDYWFVQFDFPFDFAAGKLAQNGKPYKSSGGKMVYNPTLKREIPAGWRGGIAADLLIFNPSISLKTNTEAPYLDMNALPLSGFMTDMPDRKSFKGGAKFQNGDVVVARITPCLENGKTGLITFLQSEEVGFGSTEFIVIRGKKNPLSGFASQLSRSASFRQYAISNMTGTSGRKRIDASTLETYSLPLPPESILLLYEQATTSLYAKMTNNTRENQHLTQLRDWLLPMLMNGQVTVK